MPVSRPFVVALVLFASAATAQDAARTAVASRYTIPAGWERHVVSVKFRDGLAIRLRDGALTDGGTGALATALPTLARMQRGSWSRTHVVAEGELDRLRANGERNTGRALPDLNLQFRCRLPEDIDAAAIVDALRALPCVEFAGAIPCVAPSPQGPDIRCEQIYSEPAPRGTGAGSFHGIPDNNPFAAVAARGGHARIAVIDHGYQVHPDLPPITVITPPGGSTVAQDVHGTSVLGVLAARNNGEGTTGMAHGAQFWFAHASDPLGFDAIASSVMQATWTLGPGGVILVAAQIAGPNWVGPPGAQFGLVPAEWDPATWQAIQTAVANGVVVVEAAGNGSQDLDDAAYDVPPFGPWFGLTHDSGALLVGAGVAPAPSPPAPPPSTPPMRSRVPTSNHGITLDLQGLGERVATTGAGGMWTQTFSGTSAASAVVAGAAALVQSLHFERTFTWLQPGALRQALRRSSSQQTGAAAASENVGPLPDVMRTAVELRLYPGMGFAHGFEASLPGTGGNGIEILGGAERVIALAEFDDDGPGPNPTRLYAGGGFSRIGRRPASNIACWNGSGWKDLAGGLGGTVMALAVHDADGPGSQLPQLYAGGIFGIARWNGIAWSGVGTGLTGGFVNALASIDEDGPGPAAPSLIAGGDFTNAGALVVNRVARWRNNAWSAMGSGFDGAVRVLEVYDADDFGPALPQVVAGGFFTQTGLGASMRSLAIWNGSAWNELGGGVDGGVFAIESVPVANVPQQYLFVGGSFWNAYGPPAMPVGSFGFGVWLGFGWYMPWGMPQIPTAIVGFEDGSDPTLPRHRDVYLWGNTTGSPGYHRLDLPTWGTTPLPLQSSWTHVPDGFLVYDEDGAGVEPPSLVFGGNTFSGPASSAGIAKRFGRVPATNSGLIATMPTACGWPWQPTIAVTGDPVLGLPFTVQFECLAEATPVICAGLQQPPVPLCAPGPCALGVDIIAIDIGHSGTWTFPNEPVFVGAVLAFQGVEVYAVPFGPSCAPPWLAGGELRTTDTLVLTF